jgi:hypothetical protein
MLAGHGGDGGGGVVASEDEQDDVILDLLVGEAIAMLIGVADEVGEKVLMMMMVAQIADGTSGAVSAVSIAIAA